MSDKAKTETLIPAATILLLRDGKDGLEVFMVVRHHQIDFASGALVFPGGKVAKTDLVDGIRDRVRGHEGLDDVLLALQIAAIREAFEEAGVLLARPRGSDALIEGARLKGLDAWRPKLDKGEAGILEFLEAEDLELAVDLLTPFAHWITPDMMPKRFDTHFYLAIAPSDQVPEHDGREAVDSVWIDPQVALDDAAAGKRTVIFPTRMNLVKLARGRSVSDAMAQIADEGFVTVLPKVEKRDGRAMLCIPEEANYGLTAIDMSEI
ncbi:MAG: 8-oxo-dGTP pyrophosphatase MutT (NUDIX family) [Parvibaculaceae bacterium]|jgi:8-oxo-dGTP pyrophosphatase MutT (NUDIX family)|nr:NUDIX hydrolase [Parvibaculaceae bacterium]